MRLVCGWPDNEKSSPVGELLLMSVDVKCVEVPVVEPATIFINVCVVVIICYGCIFCACSKCCLVPWAFNPAFYYPVGFPACSLFVAPFIFIYNFILSNMCEGVFCSKLAKGLAAEHGGLCPFAWDVPDVIAVGSFVSAFLPVVNLYFSMEPLTFNATILPPGSPLPARQGFLILTSKLQWKGNWPDETFNGLTMSGC